MKNVAFCKSIVFEKHTLSEVALRTKIRDHNLRKSPRKHRDMSVPRTPRGRGSGIGELIFNICLSGKKSGLRYRGEAEGYNVWCRVTVMDASSSIGGGDKVSVMKK